MHGEGKGKGGKKVDAKKKLKGKNANEGGMG